MAYTFCAGFFFGYKRVLLLHLLAGSMLPPPGVRTAVLDETSEIPALEPSNKQKLEREQPRQKEGLASLLLSPLKPPGVLVAGFSHAITACPI